MVIVFYRLWIGLSHCHEDHPDPVHDKFKEIRNRLAAILENTNLEELALGIKSGDTFLRY